MVFFTCNHCGESVKKPAVEKHYLSKCRGAPKSVSCMDCQKDFQENYVEHTKCISEMEKYSGKDYVPKPNQNKGAKKQEGWTEVVRSVLDSEEYTLNNETKKAFLTLQNYDNIPRKKPKFMNFVTNSVHLPRRIVEEVWTILEKEQEKMKQARQANAKTGQQNKNNVKEDKESVESESAVDEVVDVKKKKLKTIDDVKASEELVPDSQQNGCEKDSKKKKKKKQKDVQSVEESNVKNTLTNGNIEIEAGKKKIQKTAEVIIPSEILQENGHVEKSKKQKKKHKIDAERTEPEVVEPPTKKQKKIEANENVENLEETKPKKKAQKELKENGVNAGEPVQKKQKLEQTNNITQETSEDAYKFCWDTELARITQKYPDGLTLEKLKKKIFKKFRVKFGESEFTERQEKGFEKKLNKKLKKSEILRLEGDLVKVCS